MDRREYIRASDGNGEAVRAMVTSPRDMGDMSLITDSVLNWPHRFIATSGYLDPETGLFDEDTITVFFGHLDGSIIMIDEFAPGYSDIGHQAGEVVVIKPTTAWADVVAEEGSSGTGSGIIVSPTPPTEPEEGMFWLDETAEGEAGTNSFIFSQPAVGTTNGTNKLFNVQYGNYLGGSLQVFVNGLAQVPNIHYIENSPGNGTFTLLEAPLAGDVVSVSYQVSPASANNADTLDNYHLTAILQAIYPVGAVFVSGSPTMPELVANIGTWQRVLGRVIVGVNESDVNFNNVNQTGGSTGHNHSLEGGYARIGIGTTYLVNRQVNTPSWGYTNRTTGPGAATGSFSQGSELGGNTMDGSTLQPYKTKYMWERIS